jgi:transposase
MPGLHATPEQLCDALSATATLGATHRQILGLFLERLQLIEKQIATLDKSIAAALQSHEEVVQRLAEVPGYGVHSAQQVIAEVGPRAATFPSAEQMSSWVGTCPGREESAGISKTDQSPKGNRAMRRILNQVANAAVKSKGTVFEAVYRRLKPRLEHGKALWAVANRLCKVDLEDSASGGLFIGSSVSARIHAQSRNEPTSSFANFASLDIR